MASSNAPPAAAAGPVPTMLHQHAKRSAATVTDTMTHLLRDRHASAHALTRQLRSSVYDAGERRAAMRALDGEMAQLDAGLGPLYALVKGVPSTVTLLEHAFDAYKHMHESLVRFETHLHQHYGIKPVADDAAAVLPGIDKDRGSRNVGDNDEEGGVVDPIAAAHAAQAQQAHYNLYGDSGAVKHSSGAGAGSNNSYYKTNSRSSLLSTYSPFKPFVSSAAALPAEPLAARGRSGDGPSDAINAHLAMPSPGISAAARDDAHQLYARVPAAAVDRRREQRPEPVVMPKTPRLEDYGLDVNELQALQLGSDELGNNGLGVGMGMGMAAQPVGLNTPSELDVAAADDRTYEFPSSYGRHRGGGGGGHLAGAGGRSVAGGAGSLMGGYPSRHSTLNRKLDYDDDDQDN